MRTPSPLLPETRLPPIGPPTVVLSAPESIRTNAQAFVGLLTYGAGMLVGNYVLGFWGDSIGLDPTTQEGWLAGAAKFWLMPASLAVGVSVLFFLTFRDKSESGQ